MVKLQRNRATLLHAAAEGVDAVSEEQRGGEVAQVEEVLLQVVRELNNSSRVLLPL